MHAPIMYILQVYRHHKTPKYHTICFQTAEHLINIIFIICLIFKNKYSNYIIIILSTIVFASKIYVTK